MKKLLFLVFLSVPMLLHAVNYRMPGKIVLQSGVEIEYAAIELPAEGADTIHASSSLKNAQDILVPAESIYCIYFWTYENPAAVSALYYIPEQLPNGRIRAQWGVPTTYGAEGIAYKAYRHYVLNTKTGLVVGKREQYRGDEKDHRPNSYEPQYSFLIREEETAAKRVMINSNWQLPESDKAPSAAVARLAESEAQVRSGQVLTADPDAAEAEAYRTKLVSPLRDKHRFAIEYTNYMSNINQRMSLTYELDWLNYGIFGVSVALPVKSYSKTGYCNYPQGRDHCFPLFGFGLGLDFGAQAPVSIKRNHIVSPRLTVGGRVDWFGGGPFVSHSKDGLNLFQIDSHIGLEYRYQLPKVSLIAGLSYVPAVVLQMQWEDVPTVMPDGRVNCDISGHGFYHIATTRRHTGIHFQQGVSLTFGIGF